MDHQVQGNIACGNYHTRSCASHKGRHTRYGTIRYSKRLNVHWKAKCGQLNRAHVSETKTYIYLKGRNWNNQRSVLSPVQVQDPWRQSKWNQKDYRGKDLWNRRVLIIKNTSVSQILFAIVFLDCQMTDSLYLRTGPPGRVYRVCILFIYDHLCWRTDVTMCTGGGRLFYRACHKVSAESSWSRIWRRKTTWTILWAIKQILSY